MKAEINPMMMTQSSSKKTEPQGSLCRHAKGHTAAWLGGVALTGAFASTAYALAMLPGFNRMGPMAIALIAALFFRQFAGYPAFLRPGIHFSSKQLLRLAIILFGLKLNMMVLLEQGAGLLLQAAATILFSVLFTLLLAHKLKADMPLSLLLGIGTGICGAAAIAAVSPILKARGEDTAASVGLVALVGTIAALAYTALLPLLPLTAEQYGIWAGISLHEIAHVALAAEPAGQDAVALALLAKLSRVFLLVPVSFILMAIMNRRHREMAASPQEMKTRPEFPWFLLGFIALSLFGSMTAGTPLELPARALSSMSTITTILLTMAMVGLGLNVNLRELRSRALRPLLAMTITSVLLSVLSLLLIMWR
ncbi:putative sulfate exporter family transporter [Paenibacillus sp. FSL H8-0537]|uniref:YeiH family protein n=1 Tax=Paenibacillus sp. FSL H8-0537 TaxID=2921399 RepID=UPI003100B2A1